jgi:hypothetical protein
MLQLALRFGRLSETALAQGRVTRRDTRQFVSSQKFCRVGSAVRSAREQKDIAVSASLKIPYKRSNGTDSLGELKYDDPLR